MIVAFCVVSCLFYRGGTFRPRCCLEFRGQRNQRAGEPANVQLCHFQWTLLHSMKKLLQRALRNKDTEQPQTVLYKTAFFKPFNFFPHLTQGCRSFKWNYMKTAAKQPYVSRLNIWSKKSVSLLKTCPVGIRKCEDPFRLQQCCKNGTKSNWVFFYKQTNIMRILKKKLNNGVK